MMRSGWLWLESHSNNGRVARKHAAVLEGSRHQPVHRGSRCRRSALCASRTHRQTPSSSHSRTARQPAQSSTSSRSTTKRQTQYSRSAPWISTSPQEAANDFPVAMQVSSKYKVIYLVTKYGFIHLYDLETGTTIFMNRISSDTIFTTAPDSESSGIVGVNRKGQVLAVSVDDTTLIPYLLQNPENAELAYKLASRAGLPGADSLYQQRFDQLLSSGDYQSAAKTAANSPQGFLRTPQTIEKFKNPCPSSKVSFLSSSNTLVCCLTRES